MGPTTAHRAFTAVALAAALLACPAAAAQKRIAVLEFTAKGLEPGVLAHLSDEVRGGVLDAVRERGRAAEFLVMTRESMAVMLRDMKIGNCQEGECEVETARNMGAQYVVSGELVQIEGTYLVSLKLHETEKGALLAQQRAEGKSVLELVRALGPASRGLVDPLAPRPVAGQPSTPASAPAEGASSTAPGLGDTLSSALRSAADSASTVFRSVFGSRVHDADGDGVEDAADACPREPGPMDNRGCPLPAAAPAVAVADSDRDGIPDDRDHCPLEPGPVADDGCPRAYRFIAPRPDRIDTKEALSLDPRGPSTPATRLALDEVADLLKTMPAIRRIRVECHIDPDGRSEKDLKALTQARAESVRAYLVAAGVEAARIEAIGFGASQPAVPNTTLENRERNRRIEFVIVERK